MPPIDAHLYRAEPERRDLEQIDRDSSSEGIAKALTTEWPSHVGLASKKNGAGRSLVDYERLNALSIRDGYAIPRTDESISYVGDARDLYSLDAIVGHWQFQLDERDENKTVFMTHHGLYQCKRKPLALESKPVTFQSAINVTMASAK